MRISSRTMLPVGELSEPLLLEERQLLPDSCGGFETKWNPIATVWAKVEALVPSQPDDRWDFSEHQQTCRYWI
ncbi:MAG: hypothetical protein WCG05_04650 [Alphaproteobacteria bacterium]